MLKRVSLQNAQVKYFVNWEGGLMRTITEMIRLTVIFAIFLYGITTLAVAIAMAIGDQTTLEQF